MSFVDGIACIRVMGRREQRVGFRFAEIAGLQVREGI